MSIEDNSYINKNRIINDLNENINDNEIINILKISSEDFNDYKENFLGTNSDNTFDFLGYWDYLMNNY